MSFNFLLKVHSVWFKKITDEDETKITCVKLADLLKPHICNQQRMILNGLDVDISCGPSRDEFKLITHPGDLNVGCL